MKNPKKQRKNNSRKKQKKQKNTEEKGKNKKKRLFDAASYLAPTDWIGQSLANKIACKK